VLSLVMPYGAVFYFAAAGLVVTGIITLGVEDPVRSAAPAASPSSFRDLFDALLEGLADHTMSMLLIGTFLCALLETQMFTTLGIYMTTQLGLSKAQFGLLYTINGAAVLVLQVPALALIRRLGIGIVLPWSSFLDALGFAAIG